MSCTEEGLVLDVQGFAQPSADDLSGALFEGAGDATQGDDDVTEFGFEHLRRHHLRHPGLTWFADAGVPLHVLRKIAGHDSLMTTQRYLHPDADQITAVDAALSAHLMVLRAPRSLPVTAVVAV
ncbi:tyrosine-type recombinase/integrase [Streptomyces venezuelae]|uniref:tyrosine-type recombinase/integrase n=1 Tax=Streptomyces venezuelae TaxID=54571 RepID=UPI00362DC2EF